jgi:hypothetical protein
MSEDCQKHVEKIKKVFVENKFFPVLSICLVKVNEEIFNYYSSGSNEN